MSNPRVNRGCAPLTANRTSADCVQISLGPSIPYITVGVYLTGRYNAMIELWLSFELHGICKHCTIFWIVYPQGVIIKMQFWNTFFIIYIKNIFKVSTCTCFSWDLPDKIWTLIKGHSWWNQFINLLRPNDAYICVGNLTIIGSNNGLSPGGCQAIIWTNAGILLIWPLGTNFSEILIRILTFSFKEMHLKMSFAKWRPFCLSLNMLTQ